MKKRNAVYFEITPDLVAQSLHLPGDCKIYGCEWDFSHNYMRFYIEGSKLPSIEDGQVVQKVNPKITIFEREGVRFYNWDWDLNCQPDIIEKAEAK